VAGRRAASVNSSTIAVQRRANAGRLRDTLEMARAAAGVEESIGALLRATGPSCAVAATSRRRWMVVVGECLEAYVRTHVRLPGGWMGGWLNGGASGGLDGGCPGGPLMGWLGGGHLRRAQPSACTSSFVQVLAAGSAAASTRRRRRRIR